jgi:hypothetical protein
MKLNYLKTWSYLRNFVQDLVRRGGEPYKSKLSPYREEEFEKAEKKAPPFYWLFNAGPSLAPYKVVWKRIAGAITGKAISFASAVLEPAETEFLGSKPIILNDSLILIPFENYEEAYYVTGVLNSSIVLLAIASYTYELRQETHITQYIRIPKFDLKNPLHQKLSQLSKKAHEIARRIYEENMEYQREELSRVEDEIDKIVAQLYGITDEELEEIRKCLVILKEGEVFEEEGEGEIILPREEGVKISVEPLLVNENELRELSIKISNNLSGDLEDGRMKITLKDEVLTDQKVENVEKDKEKTLKFTLPKLKAGQYALEIVFTFKVDKQTKVVKEERMLFVKPASKKTAKVSFEGFDELLGG